MVNIKDVAAQAGVSTSTVSRALSGKTVVDPDTKKRVLQAVRDLNYQPNALAKGLKEGCTKTIGLVIPNLRNLLFPAAIRGITDVAKKHGYTLVLCNTDDDLEAEKLDVQNLRKRLVDGLIFSTATVASSYLLQLKENGYPIVLLIRHLDDALDSIIIDNYQGGYQATRFLLERGYRKIAIINGTMDLDLYRQRFAGYRAALAEMDIPFNDQLVVDDVIGWEDGCQAMLKLLDEGVMPDAVFGTSDPKAMGVIKALKERKLRVPEDVAVIGYDNLDMSQLLDPPLTTMSQPFYEAGSRAAERLIKLINNKVRSKPIVQKLQAELLVRQSVGYGKAYTGEKV